MKGIQFHIVWAIHVRCLLPLQPKGQNSVGSCWLRCWGGPSMHYVLLNGLVQGSVTLFAFAVLQ